MLSVEQKAHYDTFGFLVFRGLYSPSEMADIGRAFDEVVDEARGGKPFAGEKRQMVLGCIEKRPVLARLVEDDRTHGPLQDLLGPDFIWVTSDGNYYVGDTPWHPDASTYVFGFHMIKIAFYLDPLRRDSGCLRVIPGSHRVPFHDELKALLQHRETPPRYPFGVTGPDVPSYSLESDPGDVVLFHQSLFHASFGGSQRRRMFTLNFTEPATTDAFVQMLRQLYDNHLRYQQTNPWYRLDYLYEPDFIAGGGPRRQRMVRPLVEWGFR